MKKILKIAGLTFALFLSKETKADPASSESLLIQRPILIEETVYDEIQPAVNKENTIESRDRTYSKTMINVLSVYEGEKKDNAELNLYRNKPLMDIFTETLEENLNSNLGYYLFRKYNEGYPYPGVFVGTAGDTARKKYKWIREIDTTIRKVQDATTLKAEFSAERKIKIRPTFDDVQESQIGARIELENFFRIRKIIGRVGQETARIGFKLPENRLNLPVYLELGNNWDKEEYTLRLSCVRRF